MSWLLKADKQAKSELDQSVVAAEMWTTGVNLLSAPNSAGASVSSLPCRPRSCSLVNPDIDLGSDPNLFPAKEMVRSFSRLPKSSGRAVRRFPCAQKP